MSTLDLRIQNNRDNFLIHVADDDADVVKGLRFHVFYYGLDVRIVPVARGETGSKFSPRYGTVHGIEKVCPGYNHALRAPYAHPALPLFGPFPRVGFIWPGYEIHFTMLSASALPWPSEFAVKYCNDDLSCEKLLQERANDLKRLGASVMKMPDHMATYIGYDRLAKFLQLNPWLEIARDV